MTTKLPSEQPRQTANLILSAIWRWLVEPAAALTNPEEQHRAQLLSSLLLMITIVFAVIIAFNIPYVAETAGMDVWQGPFFYILIGYVVGLVIAYGLSRTRFTYAAGYFALGISTFVVYVSALLKPGYLDYQTIIIYLIVQFVIASFFQTLPQMIGLALIYVVLTTLVGILSPRITFAAYLTPMPFLLMMLSLTLLYMRYRDVREQNRQAELKRALHHAETLYETGRVISSTLEREDVLTRVSEQMCRAIDATSAYISSYDPVTNTTTVLAEYIGPFANPAERVSDMGASYPETQGIEFLENMQTIGYEVDHVGDPHIDPLVKEHLEQYGGKSVLYIPLRIAKQLVGYVEVWESRQRREFTPDEIALCQGIALHAALALDNAHLYEQVQQHATILEERVAARTAELEAANERLQALSQVKDEFVSNVSHELRTPISNVKLYHHLLTLNPAKQDRYLATLQRETQRLEQIVESLLHLSRLDREFVPLKLVSLDLNATAVQFVTDRLALARERGLALKLNTDPALPRVLADPQQIGQALSILLTNALNYTAAGGRVVVATHSRQLDGQQWAGISVSDTGQGIPPDEQERLFERFYRGKVGRESGLPGTGLGLAIIKEIVERHGGQVEVKSEGIPGEGATFTLWLPVKM